MKYIDPVKGRLWVEALRSGDYTQARGAFTAPVDQVDGEPAVQGYCCLAVATDVAIKNGCEDVRWEQVDTMEPRAMVRFDPDVHENADDYEHVTDDDGTVWILYDDGDLPAPVGEWLGIKADTGEQRYNPTLDGSKAVERNDSLMDSFFDIANAIETEIENAEAQS